MLRPHTLPAAELCPAARAHRDAEALRKELLAKAGQLANEAQMEAQAEHKRRKLASDKSAALHCCQHCTPLLWAYARSSLSSVAATRRCGVCNGHGRGAGAGEGLPADHREWLRLRQAHRLAVCSCTPTHCSQLCTTKRQRAALAAQGNAGSWTAMQPQQPAAAGTCMPQWVWSGLQHFAPGPAQVRAAHCIIWTCFSRGQRASRASTRACTVREGT